MLSEIYLKNFTIVKEVSLNLKSGLSVLSGETGAGKSIIIDAVSLCLGARADYSVIRHGQTQCDISLCFDLSNLVSAQQWLIKQGFDHEGECIISRSLTKTRSQSRINGRPCSSYLLRELAEQLIVIHGQHQSQSLLQREQQQQYVDDYINQPKLLQTISSIYHTWRDNQSRLQELKQLTEEREKQLDFLTYQLNELESLHIKDNEWESLHQEHQQLHQSDAVMAALNHSLALTAEQDHAALSQLEQAQQQLQKIPVKADAITSALTLLDTASIHLQEANNELYHYREQFNSSPERVNAVENRLTQLSDIARKHHTSPELLPKVTKTLQQRISELQQSDAQIAALEKEQAALVTQYQQQAQQLSVLRKKAAKDISQQITQYMQQLGMQGGEFTVVFEEQSDTLHATGQEKLAFHVKTNPGQMFQALAKVVSGGELSRISLALQTIIARKDNIPTFIFDEVDVGIGGKTAQMVGELLRNLGKTAQVYCITHLAQVAAQGQHHYQVIKSTTKDDTYTHINALNSQERVKELARMISGSRISQQTLAHAKELLTH